MLTDILKKIPIHLVLFVYLLFLGYQYYEFTNDDGSPLVQKVHELESVKKENVALQVKLKASQEFYKTLDAKRAELRSMALKLEELKSSIPTQVDVPQFMKLVLTEAKRSGLSVSGLRPLESVKKDYYEEFPFAMGFRGYYAQLVLFMDRLASLQTIIRVDDFEVKPTGDSVSRFVPLEGVLQVKAFRYAGNQKKGAGP